MPSRIRTDWPMFLAILAILAIGLTMVYSASSAVPKMLNHMQQWQPERSWEFALKQFGAATVGLVFMFALRRLDYQRLQHPQLVFLPLTAVFILLLGVIVADPKAHRWYHFAGQQFQPSELAKPALILFLAWFVARRENKINDRYTLLPAALVVVGAFSGPHGPTLANLAQLNQPYVVSAFVNSLVLSAVSASIGAVVGAVLAYAVATGSPDGILRRLVTALCGVLSQFGGVTLAFAFIATIGTEGFIVIWLQQHGITFYPNGVWLFSLTGLTLIYTYFEIPLMVIVFMPALDGVRPQWREATETLGGATWHYWRHVAGPLLLPAFLGAWLLLFANAFSAYATAAALLDIGGVIVPLQISRALSSEVGLNQANFAAALALGMVVVVAVIIVLYSWLQRRSARWLPR